MLDGPVEGLIAEHGRDHGHEPGLEPDGSLAGHVRAFKRSVHRLGAEAASRVIRQTLAADRLRL